MKKWLILFFSFFFFSTAFAESFNQIIFFGDSLTDNGNLFRLIKIIPKLPYFQGRFSNGPTWAEDLGKFYYDKEYLGYDDYAYGGATAITHLNSNSTLPITLESELDGYYLNSMLVNKKNVLYVIWIGANDYLDDPSPNIQAIVGKISWAVQSLINHGAQNFLIANLPDLGRTPYAREMHAETRLSNVTIQHNAQLDGAISQLKSRYPSITIVKMDVNASFNDVLTNPNKYNITNTVDACLNISGLTRNALKDNISPDILNSVSLMKTYQIGQSLPTPCSDPNTHLFWDPLHPTMAIHQLLSTVAIDTLNKAGFTAKRE